MTGGGRGKTFWDIRDHALIRVLTEGLRRTEVTELRMSDLPVDLVSQRVIRVVPLKGARAEEEGRVALVAPAIAKAIAAYLRVRRYHRLADSPYVWLGLRNAGPLDGMACTACSGGEPIKRATTQTCTPICSGIPLPATGCPTAAQRAT